MQEDSEKISLKRQHYIGFRSDLLDSGEYKLLADEKEFTIDEMINARQNLNFIVAAGLLNHLLLMFLRQDKHQHLLFL